MDRTRKIENLLRQAWPQSEQQPPRPDVVIGPVTINVYGGEAVFAGVVSGTGETALSRRRRQLADLPPFQPNKE